MARHWISYSVDQDPRRRPRRIWQWRWPWDWRRSPRYGRPHVVRIQPTRQRARYDDDERRRIWPWLLLLLLILLLFLGVMAWLFFDDPERSGSAEMTNDGNETGAAAELVPVGVLPVNAALTLTRADDGGAMVSLPERRTLRLDDDATVMDLGDGACHDQRYVLMTDGKVVPIEHLDQATVDALAQSDVPIDTVALSENADTDALRTIASRTGGTFTKMD